MWRLAPPLGCAHERARARLAGLAGEGGTEAYGELFEVSRHECEDGPRSRPVAHYLGGGESAVGMWHYRRGWLHAQTVRWPRDEQQGYWEARRPLVVVVVVSGGK